jgi:hypothetical protein
MPETFLIEATEELSPGDVFPDIPFPLLKYPLRTYRPDEKAKRAGQQQVFASDGKNKPGDIAHCALNKHTVMLLSHGCEVEKTLANPERRHLLVAPLEAVENPMSQELQERIRQGRQPNRLFIPSNPLLNSEKDWCVDFRRILPVPAKFLLDSKDYRMSAMGEVGQATLAAQLGVYFSGLAIYVQDVECPHCTGVLRLSDFLVASDEDDTDYPS